MHRAIVFLTCSILAAPAIAHPGPHHDIERLTIALHTEPNRVDLLLQRGEAYRLDGQLRASLADFDRVGKLAGRSGVLSLERGLTFSAMRRDSEAETELTHHLNGPHPKAVAFAERAIIRQRDHRTKEAIGDYTAAIALVPNIDWYLTRGRLQESLCSFEDAANGYIDGLSRCGGAVAIRLELLRLEIMRRHYDSATKLIDEALAQAEIKSDWYLRRAEIQSAAGKSDEAARDRARALSDAERAVSRRPTALRLLARAKARIALNQNEKAVADLQTALQKTPSLSEATGLLASLRRNSNEKGQGTPDAKAQLQQ